MRQVPSGRLRRLAEELAESGLPKEGIESFYATLVDEIDRALRPNVHERRIGSVGTILEPRSNPESWSAGTQLDITPTFVTHGQLDTIRRFTDGLSSWLLRRS